MLNFKFFIFLFFVNFNCLAQSLKECVESAAYFQDIDYEKSLKYWDMSIEIDTTDCGWLYNKRAYVKWRNEDFKGAIEDELEAIERNLDCNFLNDSIDVGFGQGAIDRQDKRSILFFTAKLQSSIKDYENAMINFTKIINGKIEGYVNIADVYFERGFLKNKLEDYNSAISDFDLALKNNTYKNNPDLKLLYSYRGYCKFKLNDYLGAINDYSRYIQDNPNNSSNAYYNRGLARIYLKQFELGCNDLSKAGELGELDAYELIKEYCNK